MSNSRKLMTVGGGGAGTYVEDVFSTYLFTGTHNGVNPPQDIVNGINLRDEGGLVWTKTRSSGFHHQLFDTERGVNQVMETASANPSADLPNSLTAFNSDGFTLAGGAFVNTASYESASWTFAKQEGFFDMVTYTGDGVLGREIPHNLGSTPGMLIVKRIDDGGYDWMVQSRALGGTKYLSLNQTSGAILWSAPWNNTDATSDVFTVGSDAQVNASNSEYVAYLFADDAQMFGPDGDESIIKCGSYTGTSNTSGPEIDLGWEPQFLLIKKSSGSENWIMLDTMRGIPTGGNFSRLNPNLTDAEQSNLPGLEVTPTGFKLTGPFAQVNDNGDFIYMAIRRPHKPAEEFEPEELFATVAGDTSAEPGFSSGFPVDMAWYKATVNQASNYIGSRLIQGNLLLTNDADGQTSFSSFMFDYPDGWLTNAGSATDHSWMFRRAPGFFDVVTYTGDDVPTRTVAHNLGVTPEFIVVKRRDGVGNWVVYNEGTSANPEQDFLFLNGDDYVLKSIAHWNYTAPTDTHFAVRSSDDVNGIIGDEYIAFLWASVPGICDIGSFTADYTETTIDCGFTNGARFVLMKRIDSNGDWLYWDTLRGITPAGTDSPYLRLNTTDTQNNADSLHPASVGFTLVAGHNTSNINGAKYIYMAIA